MPWDRPDDYEQPTDTAAPDEQTAWDRPPYETWVDPNPEWPPVAEAVASQEVGGEQAVESADPYDAHAPVVGDVAPTMTLAWPEANGHHADLNGSGEGQTAYTDISTPVDSAPGPLPVEDPPQAVWPESSSPEATALPESEPEWKAPESAWSAEPEPAAPEPEPAAPEDAWSAEPEPAAPQPEPAAPEDAWSAEPEPAAPQPEWSAEPEPEPEVAAAVSSPEPEPAAIELPMPAQPAGYAEHQMGPTPPDDLFFTAAVAEVAEQDQEQETGASAEHSDDYAWLDETSAWPSDEPAPDLPSAPEFSATHEYPPAPEFPPAPDVPMAPALGESVESAFEATDTDDWEQAHLEVDGEPEQSVEAAETEAAETEAAETAAPEAVAPEPATQSDVAPPSVVLRIELAIIDGQLQVVSSAADAKNVTPDVDEPVNVTPRDPEFDARPDRAPVDDEASDALPLAPLESATDHVPWSNEVDATAIPAATPAVPWADAPWAQNPPSTDPLAAIPAQHVAAAPAQQAFTSHAAIAPSIFAPPLEPYDAEPAAAVPLVDMTPAAAAPAEPAAAQAQNDLWFLSTEPTDVDAVTGDDEAVAARESSSTLTAVLTIGMAILVIVLVLVFFSLMTSLLG